MGYRDDLEAALAHVDSLEADCEGARAEIAGDRARIAELERQLADARAKLEKLQGKPKTEKPKTEKPKPRENERAQEKPTRQKRQARIVAGVTMAVIALIIGGTTAILIVRSQKLTARFTLFDVSGELVNATRLAQGTFADAELTGIQASYVDPDGLAELQYNGDVIYYYTSPSRRAQAAPASTAPLGAPREERRPECALRVKAQRRWQSLDVSTRSRYGDECPLPVRAPRCSLGDVWAKAIAQGAPSHALARVGYEQRKHGDIAWALTITDGNKTLFDATIPDDCTP